MLRASVTILAASMSLAILACGSPAGAPATTSAPAASAAPTSTLAARAATAAAAPTAAPTARASSKDPSLASGTIRYEIVPDGTQASFRVREQLADRSFPSDAVGTSKALTGSITLDADGKIRSDQSKFVIDMTSLKTDSQKRDGFIQRSTLNTAEYPTAEFVPTEIRGLPSPLPADGNVTFQLLGNMTVHGVTHPVTWNVTGQVDGTNVTGKATTSFKFEDFGMSPPHVAVVLSVQDNINLEVDFHAARAG